MQQITTEPSPANMMESAVPATGCAAYTLLLSVLLLVPQLVPAGLRPQPAACNNSQFDPANLLFPAAKTTADATHALLPLELPLIFVLAVAAFDFGLSACNSSHDGAANALLHAVPIIADDAHAVLLLINKQHLLSVVLVTDSLRVSRISLVSSNTH